MHDREHTGRVDLENDAVVVGTAAERRPEESSVQPAHQAAREAAVESLEEMQGGDLAGRIHAEDASEIENSERRSVEVTVLTLQERTERIPGAPGPEPGEDVEVGGISGQAKDGSQDVRRISWTLVPYRSPSAG